MGKSLIRIVESVKEELSHYKLTDDFPITDEYLADKADDVRASLIREAYKNKKIDEKYYQQMCCIEIECAKPGCDVNGVNIPMDYVVWYADLPTLVQDIGWDDIKYFGLMGFIQDFDRKSMGNWINIEGNVWTGLKPAYTIIGNRAYFKNLPTSGITFLCLVAILYKPTTACNYQVDDEYPVPSDMTLQMLMKKDILSTGFIPLPDKIHDGKAPDITDMNPGKKR